MKPPFIATAAILPIIAIALAGCAGPQTSEHIATREFVRVGEVMLHVDATEDVRAASAKAVRGYSELCYLGLNPAMQPMFQRRDVDIVTGETPAQPKVLGKPPEAEAKFALDFSKGRLIALRGRTIEIIEANPAGVTFTVRPNGSDEAGAVSLKGFTQLFSN
ncbi:MAG: hypothetical protein ACLPX9_07840 [Rhodomicrobium sp.]